MGECAYYLKAAFPSEAIAIKTENKLEKFFAEAQKAYDFWQTHRGIGESEMTEEVFWKEYAKKFPTMMEFAQSSGLDTRESLSSHVDFGQTNDTVLRQGNVLCWADSSVRHFADWSHLAAFIKKKFGATKVVYNTEENGCGSLESLQLYEWEDIVKDILKQKELHPLLIGVNPELDTLLETAMKKRGKK